MSDDLIVVGLGASAGGLQALEDFFGALPAEPGFAFVVITHQSASRSSVLPLLLKRRTTMPVVMVSEGLEVAADRLYVTPPEHDVTLLGGRFHLEDKQRSTTPHLPIDHFFASLAVDQKDHAVGIVLSGMGSDGTKGLRERSRRKAGSSWCRRSAKPALPGCRTARSWPTSPTSCCRRARCLQSSLASRVRAARATWGRASPTQAPGPCARYARCCACVPGTTSPGTRTRRCGVVSSAGCICTRSKP